jgi:GH15 family glucan-1,4-alpha-glucosidase
MVATWIEQAAKGRHGGPVRAGMWASVVVGTHPIEANQEVWLEITVDDVSLGPLPAYWVENKGVNSLWHVPIPPQGVGVRLHYRSGARSPGSEQVTSPAQDTIVRPNLPDRSESSEIVGASPEGLVGNRQMTARVDARGSTYDLYFPTVGMHCDVRPANGDWPQSRAHFRAIVGGLAVGRRLDWFTERLCWEAFQHYQGATNLLMTELSWRNGPIRVLATDFVAMGDSLPRTAGGTLSPGQYIKRFRMINEGTEPRRALFGVYIQTEVNGGIGDPGLSWHDGDRTLLATNRGHGHVNRKLARDSTVEFAIALDDRGDVLCEPTGRNEAILLRWLELPPGAPVTVDLLVSGAFTGWRGDPGTFEHWLRPALAWFRSADLDLIEQRTGQEWDSFVAPLPNPHYPKPNYAVSLRRAALAAALHADAEWGAIASGFERGLSAYCWPREAVWVGDTLARLGHPEMSRSVYRWLATVRGRNRPFPHWFQKYTIDGGPEWETPAVDQTAMIPWGLERYYHRTGDLAFVAASWPMIEQAAQVCTGQSGHPGLRLIEELHLITSAGIWDHRFGAFLHSNATAVAGLRAAARLARLLDRSDAAARWEAMAERIWEQGILGGPSPSEPGLIDHEHGRFIDARQLSTLRGLWTDQPDLLIERSTALDISMLGPVVPLGLLSPSDPRMIRTAEAILRNNAIPGNPNLLTRWSQELGRQEHSFGPGESHGQDVSSLATLWMARYLIRLGNESGHGRHWNRALAMVDAILGRLFPLGLMIRPSVRLNDAPRIPHGLAGGAWGLHAMLADTLLDFAGLDYHALERRLTLEPALPSPWSHVGLIQHFPCGEVGYRLDRPIGGTVHHLSLKAHLDRPVTLHVAVTCPGLTELGPWHSNPVSPPPEFDPRTGRLTWSLQLPAEEEILWSWTWG